MKPWCVVKYPKNPIDFQVGRGTGIIYVEPEPDKKPWDEDMYGREVYFFNDENAANHFLDVIARNNTNNMYIVCQCKRTAQSIPGPVNHGEFTIEGYMPV